VLAEYLFFNRDHPQRAVRRFPTHHARAGMEDPALAGRRLLPYWRILREYVRSVQNAPLGAGERTRCYAELAHWVARHGNWARLAVDPVIALAPASGPVLARLAASQRRWLGRRVRASN
jgi:hypothetical protein